MTDAFRPNPILRSEQASASAVDPIREPLLDMIDAGGLPITEPHDCPYLADRQSQSQGFVTSSLHAETYHDLMDMGFRRSGRVFYRPQCPSCQACVPIRIPVESFKRSKSQRRAWQRNSDVSVEISEPKLDDERVELYQRYLNAQHPGSPQSNDPDGVEEFLYNPVVESIEVSYRVGEGDHAKLIAVSILDVCSRSVSSVYHYFDPVEAKRSLGVFSVLMEVELTRAWHVPHFYLGYWIKGCQTMDYKGKYRPHELLVGGRWVRVTQ